MMTDFEWEVWVCMEHPCATDKNERVCFTYSEAHYVFFCLSREDTRATFLKQ